MKKIVLISVILFVTSTGLINAQQTVRQTTSRQVKQQARIEQGVKSGELTKAETARLEREQRRIQIEKRMAKADGTVTPAEKRFLKREQNRASRDIRRQKNDPQGRGL
jgi:DNA-binding transcriptional regulator of glucitol operon